MKDRGMNWFGVEILTISIVGVVAFLMFPNREIIALLSDPSAIHNVGLLITETLLSARAAVIAHWLLAFPAAFIIGYVAIVVSSGRRAGT